jgi:hypothetical protein
LTQPDRFDVRRILHKTHALEIRHRIQWIVIACLPGLFAQVSDVQPNIDNAKLQRRTGMVLLPFWICEYTLNGKSYRAFQNGATGRIVGAPAGRTHPVTATPSNPSSLHYSWLPGATQRQCRGNLPI